METFGDKVAGYTRGNMRHRSQKIKIVWQQELNCFLLSLPSSTLCVLLFFEVNQACNRYNFVAMIKHHDPEQLPFLFCSVALRGKCMK